MKKNIKLISCILALCLNIAVLIVAVYGWFLSNKNVSSSVSGMVEDIHDCVEGYEFYDAKSVDFDENNQAIYTFDLTSSGTSTMNTYDQLGNKLTGKLLEITFKDSSNYTLTANTSTSSYLGLNIRDEDNNFIFKGSNNPISSVILFKCISSPTITNNTITATMEKTSSFVTDLNTSAWTTEVILGEVTSNKAYIIMDYYEASIENIYTLNIGNPVLDTGINISYYCDFSIRVN